MKEIWKDIKGYEGKYQISNKGNIRSLNYRRTGKTKILQPGKDKDGYLLIGLRKDGKKKTYKIHRLVAEAFLENPNKKPQINHIDGNKQNNYISNLEWCTNKENMAHAYTNGLALGKHGKQTIYIAAEANKKPVRCITTDTTYKSATEAESLTGVAHQNIAKCCKHTLKSAGKLPDGTKLIWEYV